ncbi:hypothetical protein [Albidovulum sp.]|uniref:hypothetical protein n=1 Tax=Albidovulum sp. TaxID=1872424 RepID=UPI0039B98480
MSKTGEIPYNWPQIEEQIRKAILAQASILEAFGPWCEGRTVAEYLGIPSDEFRNRAVDDITNFDLPRHQLFRHVRIAYDYAYQIHERQDAEVEYWYDTVGLLQGFPETNAQGEPSPFCRLNDFPLRRVLETFFARYALFDDEGPLEDFKPSIRELSLLSNMTVPAVRTSLSKEGFKLEKAQAMTRTNPEEGGFRLNADDARLWLSRRRGFIPQRAAITAQSVQPQIDKVLSDREVAFPLMVSRIMALRNIGVPQVTQLAALDHAWLSDLIAERPVNADLISLRSIARVLEVPEPDFVAMGIRHILTAEATNTDA